jgi:hypothetical protein
MRMIDAGAPELITRLIQPRDAENLYGSQFLVEDLGRTIIGHTKT